MGFIEVLSRKGEHGLIYNNVLSDTSDHDDELAGFLPGDSLYLNLSLPAEQALELKEKNFPGIVIQQTLWAGKGAPVEYEAQIEGHILRRIHSVSRDWTANDLGLRTVGTTVVVELDTDEAEELFLKLQQRFQIYVQDYLYHKYRPSMESDEAHRESGAPF